MSDVSDIATTIIGNDFPEAFKQHLDIDVVKLSLRAYYSEERKTLIVRGKVYGGESEEQVEWNTLATKMGKFLCTSRTTGAFGLGPLKGKRVIIEDVEVELDLNNYPNLKRTLNLEKLKGGVERHRVSYEKVFI